MMKKLLVVNLFLLVTAFAMSQTFTIGTGTSTVITNPFNGSYGYGWCKTIYTQAELVSAGMTAATNISAISIYVGSTPSNYVMNNQHVYMRHSSQAFYGSTDVSYPDQSQFSHSWQGSITYNGSGWKLIQFTTPFAWNGTSNIEILYENRNGANPTGYPTFRYTSTSSVYKTVYVGSSTSFPSTTNGTRSYNRSNIQLTISPSLPNPAIIVSPANAATGVNPNVSLNWSSGGAYTSGYRLYVGTNNPPTNLVNNQDLGNVATFDPTPDLNLDTTYYWKVIPYNSTGDATNCPVWSFTTNYFAGGAGTETNPWQISTAGQLNNIRDYLGSTHSNKYFVQTADINLGVAPWNLGNGWEPIGNSSSKF